MQKGFAGIVLILVLMVVLAGVGSYYFYKANNKQSQNILTPQTSPLASPNLSDETANWKTYTDKDNGFSFKYPESYDIEKSDFNQNSFLKPVGLTAQEAQKLGKYYILFGPEVDPRTIEEYATTAKTNGIDSKITYLTLNNAPALAWLYKMGSSDDSSVTDKINKQYFIYSKDLAVVFEDSGVLDSDHTFLDKVVSTFKFLK